MTITPPAVLPWDVTAIRDRALTVLRLSAGDPDVPAVTDAAATACELVTQRLDWDVSPWATADDMPPDVVTDAVNETVRQYRGKDAPFGTTDTWTPDGALLGVQSVTVDMHARYFDPHRGRQGVA